MIQNFHHELIETSSDSSLYNEELNNRAKLLFENEYLKHDRVLEDLTRDMKRGETFHRFEVSAKTLAEQIFSFGWQNSIGLAFHAIVPRSCCPETHGMRK